MATTVILIVAAYFFCAIPTAYLLVKLVSGKDLRKFGSGSVTGSNAGQVVGKWATVVVGVTDIAKGGLPVWIAQGLDCTLAQQVLVAIAGVIGHNWSIYIGGQGGRGMAVVIGVLLALARIPLLLFVIIGLFGIAFIGNMPLVMGFSMALPPLWAFVFGEKRSIIVGLAVIVLVVLAKRLTGNWTPLPPNGGGRVLLYRFLYDRDTKERNAWVRRTTADNASSTGTTTPTQAQS